MHRWVDHTAEVELEIDAASEEEVFADALAAFRELLEEGPVGAGGAALDGPVVRRSLAAVAPDRAALLAAWVEELVFAAETDGFVPRRLRRLGLEPERVVAEVEGVLGDPPHLVKAVTYHRLTFAREGGRWRARLVLDV